MPSVGDRLVSSFCSLSEPRWFINGSFVFEVALDLGPSPYRPAVRAATKLTQLNDRHRPLGKAVDGGLLRIS
jgi:hypothetical protein